MLSIKKNQSNNISDDTVKDMMKKSNSFFSWIQEYSKKIISITFFIYIAVNIYCLAMTIYVFQVTQEFQSLDTLIMEINQTFRDVIGGYIVKAAVENVSKHSGIIVEKWLDTRLDSEFKHKETEDSVIEERNGLTWKKQK